MFGITSVVTLSAWIQDKENRDDLRVIATGSLLGDGQRWKKKYLCTSHGIRHPVDVCLSAHSEVSTTTASLPAAADEKSAGYCGGDTRPRRHSSKVGRWYRNLMDAIAFRPAPQRGDRIPSF